MADSRINRLSQLLESRNRVLRGEAATQLAQFPLTNAGLVQNLRKQLQSASWETRSAAADALGHVLDKLNSRLAKRSYDYSKFLPQTLDKLNIGEIVKQYNFLVSCDETSIPLKKGVKLSKKEQRQLVDQHLDLNFRTGVSCGQFLADEDLGNDASNDSSSSDEKKSDLKAVQCELPSPSKVKAEIKQEMAEEKPVISGEGQNGDQGEEGLGVDEENVFYEFLTQVLTDLASPKWQQRHGNAMAVGKIVQNAFKILTPEATETLTVRMIFVLSLDRFNDFVTGSNAVAPVREAIGQGLSLLMLKIGIDTPLVSALINPLRQLLCMKGNACWQCRQAALLVLKYYFSMCDSGEKFFELFDFVVKAMYDKMDEVVSVSVHTLSSLFNNQKIDPVRKRDHIDVVMKSVWWMLMENDSDSMQINDGVSSLLVDLLGIVQNWLVVVEDSQLSQIQFNHIISLLDPSQITSTMRTMECICLSLGKQNDFTPIQKFNLIKMLYRCLLFVQPSDSKRVIDLVFSTLMKLISTTPEAELAAIPELQNSIGYWVGCLTYDIKSSEIDVFLHNVNGPSSSVQNSKELLCGDELRFLDEKPKHNAFMDRKCFAARFLSPIIDTLYRSNVQIQDQPLYLSLQLHFIPYLRSNSLYQRMGVALMLNCWSRMFRRAFNAQKQQQYPTLIVAELERLLLEAPTRPPYDEPATMIKSLTAECNEFRRHCIQKGVPHDKCPGIDPQTNVDEAINAMYNMCKPCLIKQQDLDALEGRRKYLIQMTEATRFQILTNNNRLNALCASTLFYFGHCLPQMTPMIKPLIDALNTEDNELISEEIFYDSFTILFSVTLERNPCPHPKVLKQLSNGLIEDKTFIPKTKQLESDQIISTSNPPPAPVTIRAKNCEIALRKYAEQLGQISTQICPNIAEFLKLNQNLNDETELEVFLTNLEFIRILSMPMGHQPKPEEIAILKIALGHTDPAVRFRTARCITELAVADLAFVLNNFFEEVRKFSDQIDSSEKRAGAVEFLAILVAKLDPKVLITAASLLAPLALKMITDQVEAIRELAALAFGKLVALLHLEADTEPLMTRLTPELQIELEESKDFVNVLSQPSKLPALTQEQVPGLKPSIKLRAYQLEGITWMRFLSRFGLNGILADDMGLGKTIQTLSVLSLHRKTSPRYPSLIICPRTLTNHWCNEWRNYFPNEKPMHRVEVDVKILPNSDEIVVMSYEELRTNAKRFNDFPWKFLVLDEGHCIRNPNTNLFEAIMTLKAKHKLLLSGTPVQNSPADLWALFKFLMPGYLFTRQQFQQRFLKPILACRNPKASEEQTKQGEESLQQLHRLILPFVMRRLKTDVLKELPDKVVQDWVCQLTEAQKRIYQAVVDRCSLVKKENETEVEKKRRLSPLHTLIALRQLVDHPVLINEVLKKIEYRTREYDPNGQMDYAMELSGKMMALKEILQECQIGDSEDKAPLDDGNTPSTSDVLEDLPALTQHRALIFCQWRASIDLVAKYIDDASLGENIKYLRLDGTVAPNDRQAVVDRFNNDPTIDLLLVTTHIGGVGLTLTGADVVIFLDHDWNPVKDLQAVDRAHRLGQTKTVQVFRLITQGSIEEKIMQYQKFKTDTANALVGADNRSISSMATDELLELFNLAESETSKPSEPAPKKKRVAKEQADPANPTEWSMEDLWDSSQYEENHSIQEFMKNAL
ncbi:unnamed protein product [Bursaphelenchus xylophilus]|uniref:(pine wood nematode) hypothetical protein n=1 Tax=Bursaphelenchus xylophilus TaxID=6326 RepID=A0A1I7S8P0_BURXY|nr:unnamed protein product [Bursaphelenchus xylophilus]CAG9089411.1 unnamed protein product [Bursaphelenchus xylophilus]